jgi:7-alpha-hydroxysteroid dehydrogenase
MILDRFSVAGRVGIVTGAGQGIGRGIAIGLAEAGADIVLAARTESDLDEVAAEIGKLGRRAFVVPTDVMDHEAREVLVARAIEEFGHLEILVNNAGGSMPAPAMSTSERSLEKAFSFNVTAAFSLTKLAARAMVDTSGGGAVVNISSRCLRNREGGAGPPDAQYGARARSPGETQCNRRWWRRHQIPRDRAHR